MSVGSDGSGTTSAWWSDALNDPWRNPESATLIVSNLSAPPPPVAPVAPEPAGGGPRRGISLIVTVALISGLAAGALGGAIGFVAASGRTPSTVLGSGDRSTAPPPQRPAGSLPALIARVMPSVVTVEGSNGQAISFGSGFVITKDGYILTNEHVVADVSDRALRVTLADTTVLPGRVVGRDAESDLAVIKVDRDNLRPVELGNSDAVAVGDGVLAIGAPLALSGTVTAGIVSALDRTIETRDLGGAQRYYAAIQTDAAVNRGNSGGPLFDFAGRVIGINSVIKSLVEDGGEAGNIGIAFAIPINQAGRVAAEIINTGHARRTVIGAKLEEFRGQGGGARLASIDSGGPAANAGLKAGDIVTRIGTHLVEQPHDLIALVRRYNPGTVVAVVYRRGSETMTANVTLVADAN